MRIGFLTSCLEPGRDGVGDYTRQLAAQCQRLGQPCGLLALHDRWIKDRTQQEAEPVPTLRLGTNLPWSERIRLGRQFLAGADWVSLQFVCYGFHPKGLSLGLTSRLKRLLQGHRVHLMCHELWIGAEQHARFTAKCVGALQRMILLHLIRALPAQVVQTSNTAYQTLLQHQGVGTGCLPLFGSIPIQDHPDPDWFLSRLRQAGIPISPEIRPHFWLFGFFGTLHPIWPAEPLFSQIRRAGRAAGKRIVICAAGRLGSGQDYWRRLVSYYGSQFDFCCLGELPPERISAFLQGIDFGIATTPLALLGKSGTAAAMLEHGLPLIVNRDELRFRSCPENGHDQPQLIRPEEDLAQQLRGARRQPPHPALPDVTRQFLSGLDRAKATC